jgi:hypothetical protein
MGCFSRVRKMGIFGSGKYDRSNELLNFSDMTLNTAGGWMRDVGFDVVDDGCNVI